MSLKNELTTPPKSIKTLNPKNIKTHNEPAIISFKGLSN